MRSRRHPPYQAVGPLLGGHYTQALSVDKLALLRNLSVGRTTAEDEREQLARYFVETEYWRQIMHGDADIVYGSKDTGKSAIYLLILAHEDCLFDKGIILVSGEKLIGAPVFQELITGPPAGEREFIRLWKLYFLTLIGRKLHEFDVQNAESKKVQDALEFIGLLKRKISLSGILSLVKSYVRRLSGLEGGVQIDQNTGMPMGVTGKIVFAEPDFEERRRGLTSVDELLHDANKALRNAGFKLWVMLDRLDVAFADSPNLENNALRGLFRVYRDLQEYENIRPKIFLRSDIWRRITAKGFRESSHITSYVTLIWDQDALLNLVVRRLLDNDALCEALAVDKSEVLKSIKRQQEVFYRLFPNQVDLGEKKPRSFDWLLSRTADGSDRAAPRELIHMIAEMRNMQLTKMERGEVRPSGDTLFDRSTFKDALPEVSRMRLEQTLFAEYPEVREWLLPLKGKKTQQDRGTLAATWHVNEEEAAKRAARLVDVGFFVKRTEGESTTFWVPFLYRDALELVQGRAEE